VVPANRLSVLPLYRLGVGFNFAETGKSHPTGPWAAAFLKREAIAIFGALAVQRAWVEGLTAMEADEWAVGLADWHPQSVWPQWEWLAEREAAAGGAPPGARTAAARRGE
jgi:hypothetical protein